MKMRIQDLWVIPALVLVSLALIGRIITAFEEDGTYAAQIVSLIESTWFLGTIAYVLGYYAWMRLTDK
jgi:hypothetical protein